MFYVLLGASGWDCVSKPPSSSSLGAGPAEEPAPGNEAASSTFGRRGLGEALDFQGPGSGGWASPFRGDTTLWWGPMGLVTGCE